MRIIGLKLLHDFCADHADCRSWINNWVSDIKDSSWQTPHELTLRYPSASVIGNGKVIFNVRGNLYRLETHIAYQTQTVMVTWIGTHAEYTKRNK